MIANRAIRGRTGSPAEMMISVTCQCTYLSPIWFDINNHLQRWRVLNQWYTIVWLYFQVLRTPVQFSFGARVVNHVGDRLRPRSNTS